MPKPESNIAKRREDGQKDTSSESFNALKIFLDKEEKAKFLGKLSEIRGEIAKAKKDDIRKQKWNDFLGGLVDEKQRPIFSSMEDVDRVLKGFTELLQMKVGLLSAMKDIKSFKEKLAQQKPNIDKISSNAKEIESFFKNKLGINLLG